MFRQADSWISAGVNGPAGVVIAAPFHTFRHCLMEWRSRHSHVESYLIDPIQLFEQQIS